MKLPKDARKLSKQLFKGSFTDGRLDPNRVKFIADSLIKSKPRHYVGILREYQRSIRMELEKHQAVIDSATPLDPRTSEQLTARLKEKYGSDLSTEFKVAPELLGGLRIKVGNDVFDGTVRERLHRLETELARG
jgi:F-type H+-transporting ATPase subunit delta